MAIVQGVALNMIAKPKNHEVTKYRIGRIPHDVLHSPIVPLALLLIVFETHEQFEKT